MSYTFITKKAFTSNKPPEPNPTPHKDLFPTELIRENGSKAWVSIPQPDKLSFTIQITSKVMGSSCPVDHPPAEIAKIIGDYLLSEPFNSDYVDHKMHYDKPTCHRVRLRMGKRGSTVLFAFLRSKKLGHRLQVQCNPRKLGPIGMLKLTQVLVGCDSLTNFGSLFSPSLFAESAKLTRLDIAIDVVGVPVEHLIAWNKHEGKRIYYSAKSGTLETVMVHRIKPTPKPKYDTHGAPKKLTHSSNPAGQLLLKIYDRVQERAALLKSPPYGPAPVSRIEVVKNRFPKKYLKDIPHLTDPFKDTRIGSIFEQVEYDRSLFFRYATLRKVTDHKTATIALGVIPKDAILFEKALSIPNPQFVNCKTNWSGWDKGLIQTGLIFLINAEETANLIANSTGALVIGSKAQCN